MEQIHIARHPVLDRDQEIYGYELQFRSPAGSSNDPSAVARDYPTKLVDIVDSPEFEKLLGGLPAFVHLTEDFVQKGFSRLLPTEQVIPELLQTMDADDSLLETLQKARKEGFRLAFSLLLSDPDYFPVYKEVAFLKVDLNLFQGENLDRLLQTLQDFPPQLIADNIHTQEAFELARSKGFDLFQGQFFAKPAQITTQTLSPQKITLLTVYRQIAGDADLQDIERTFKENPDLSYKLLRMVNSAAFYRPKEIHSIRQALAMLGQRNLQKWVGLLLYSGAGREGGRNPLLEEAVIRGRMMEMAARKLRDDPELSESAFMTGSLSVIEALLSRPMSQVLEELSLGDDIGAALLRHEGLLGDLLTTTIRLREDRALPQDKPDNLYQLTDEDLYYYEEQATREFEDLEN